MKVTVLVHVAQKLLAPEDVLDRVGKRGDHIALSLGQHLGSGLARAAEQDGLGAP